MARSAALFVGSTPSLKAKRNRETSRSARCAHVRRVLAQPQARPRSSVELKRVRTPPWTFIFEAKEDLVIVPSRTRFHRSNNSSDSFNNSRPMPDPSLFRSIIAWKSRRE